MKTSAIVCSIGYGPIARDSAYRYVGLDNFRRALDDEQFWVSFLFTVKYTVLLTPVLIVGGYLLALLTAQNTPMRRFTRTVVFIPIVIGLGVSSLLWYWLFSTDFVRLDLDLPVRITEPDPRVDAVRGCVAIERGPLVYCVESADLPARVVLEDLRWDGDRADGEPVAAARPDLAESMVGVEVPMLHRDSGDRLTVGAIPYFAWANRQVAAMRVAAR